MRIAVWKRLAAFLAITLAFQQISFAGEIKPQANGQASTQVQESAGIEASPEAQAQAGIQEGNEVQEGAGVQEKPSEEYPDLSMYLMTPIIPSYLPIIMYHQISRENSRLGSYVISDAEFDADLKLLKDNGYTTVTISDLLAYVDKKATLPDKPVMLTFDDGFQSDYI
jgi:hypothetical protein